MIRTHDLRKKFGARWVLTGFDLTAEPGAVTLLVGANGAGKTTALRLVAGLAEADAGVITIGGHDLRRARGDALAQLSFLPQAPRFHPRLTAAQVAGFYAQLRGRDHCAAEASLERWGLDEFAHMPTGRLSGGLRQRLALAIFALTGAPVLVLDEPGLSLDPAWREHLHNFLAAEARLGRTVLIATHLLGEWEGRADRCVLMTDGRCERELPPDELRDAFFGREHREPLAACA